MQTRTNIEISLLNNDHRGRHFVYYYIIYMYLLSTEIGRVFGIQR